MTLIGRYLIGGVFCLAALASFIEASPAASSSNFQCTTEEHRSRYHFSAKENWLNDPNGMVYYDGLYHLFYQYHPNSSIWGPMYWGHAVSRNLATWEELPIALAPNELGNIFSGSAVVDFTNTTGFKSSNNSDPIVAIYTSADEELQRQSIAYSLDGGITFTQYSGNPVLEPGDTSDFRDPKVMFHDNRWIMSLAVKDRIEFYSSPDLKSWTRESEIGREPKLGNHDGVWECPDLIPLTVDITDQQTIELWVLLVSINPGGPNGGSATQYFIGDFTRNNTEKIAFHAFPWSNNQWLDWGPDNYAGVTFSNEPRGRQIYIGWMSNWIYANETPNKAHRGQMTLPRRLGLRVLNHTMNQYRLTSTPLPELANLRHPHQAHAIVESFPVLPQTLIQLTEQATFDNPLMELEIGLHMKNNPQFSICAYNEDKEEVCFGHNSTHWYLDRSKSGNTDFNENYSKMLVASAVREITDEFTNIRIFIDVSSIEVYCDDGLTTMTALHFPSKPFNKFYINNWSKATSLSSLTVNSFGVHGLQCWFAEHEPTNAPGAASSMSGVNFAILSVINVLFAFRQYFH